MPAISLRCRNCTLTLTRDGIFLWGRVVGESSVRDTHTHLRLALDRVRIDDEEHLVKGKILVRTPHYPACVCC